MKKFSLIILSAFTLLLWSCTDSSEAIEPESDFVEVSIPEYYKYNDTTSPNSKTSSTDVDVVIRDIKVITAEGKEVFGKVRITMPDSDEETLISLEITNNIFEETPLNPDFWTISDTDRSAFTEQTQSSCLASCQEAFTNPDGSKIDGRGACKAQCWVETAVKVAAVVVAIVAL